MNAISIPDPLDQFYEVMPKGVSLALDREQWHYAGYRYVCNGHVVLWMPERGIPDSLADKIALRMDKLRIEMPAGDYIPVPVWDGPEADILCIECKGSGKVRHRKCPDCDGHGEAECDMGHLHDCDNCDGNGSIPDSTAAESPCGGCGGCGMHGGLPIAVGKVSIAARYAKLIAMLPGARIQDAKEPAHDKPIYFLFDGGAGIVMPMRVNA